MTSEELKTIKIALDNGLEIKDEAIRLLLSHIKGLESRLPRWILAADISPPEDGTHILVCRGRYDKGWTFREGPPAVVHFFEGSMGFELSMGSDENSSPVEFTHWMPLPKEPEE